MNVETLAALADEAHKHGQRGLTHTVTVERGKLAADAGIDVIAHSIQDGVLDADAIARIKKAGTFYAPTLAIYQLKHDEMGPGRKDDDSSAERRVGRVCVDKCRSRRLQYHNNKKQET